MSFTLNARTAIVALLFCFAQTCAWAQHAKVAVDSLENNASPPQAVLAEPPPLRLIWQRTPLAIGLPVGKERMVSFPTQVRLGLPPAIAGHVRVQVVDRTAYLYATAPFEQTRLVAENPLTGAVYLLDLSAKALFSNAVPVEIFEEPKLAANSLPHLAPDSGTQDDPPDWVALTRHAAQQVYAPRRMHRALPNVRPIALDSTSRTDFYRFAKVQADPIASWRAGLHYVTAVRLSNQSSAPIELDPRALRGRWLAATFQHGRILPRGHEEDTTVVYLISAQRFDESY